MNHEEAKAIALNCLAEEGWVKGEHNCLATKVFETAVGEKVAHAYLFESKDEFNQFRLEGDYQTEGRNCLASSSVLIPRNPSAEQVQKLATQFSTQAIDAVENSYAAKLYRNRQAG